MHLLSMNEGKIAQNLSPCPICTPGENATQNHHHSHQQQGHCRKDSLSGCLTAQTVIEGSSENTGYSKGKKVRKGDGETEWLLRLEESHAIKKRSTAA